ncbi:MAG: methyltransferase domain-containing protein [Planctomycetes bacterium]|nr:methyltransferase domain-containing protein [Planctomycetota bacterium]
MPDEINQPRYWDSIYKEPDEPRWVLGQAAPPLTHWLKSARRQLGRVAVLGCGYGHDALAFAEHGFDAVGYDFAELAITRGQERVVPLHKGGRLKLVRADFFELPATESGRFDYVYEYTSFVAVAPERRQEYAQMCHAILKPGGILVGCFYNHGRDGGPPFDARREDVLRVFSPLFEIKKLEVSEHSIERRKGHELWAEFVKK